MNDLSLYTIYQDDTNNYMICNTYIIVHNSKNDYHMFYGYYPFIKCDNNIENNLKNIKGKNFELNDLLNCLYQGFIQQPINKSIMMESIKITLNNNIEFENKHDDTLYNSFCGFLNLYLKSIISHNTFTISRIDRIIKCQDDKFNSEIYKDMNIYQNETGLKISINIDEFIMQIKHKGVIYLLNNCKKKSRLINEIGFVIYETNNNGSYTDISSIYEDNIKYMYNIYIYKKYDHDFIIKNINDFLYNNYDGKEIKFNFLISYRDELNINDLLRDGEYIIL